MKARFYFDVISPFSYFYVKLRHRLDPRLEIEPVPVLLGGLLRATHNQGPGEIPAKRIYTYEYCVWQAKQFGIPFRFPERHPFITLAPQRLLVQEAVQETADWNIVERAFEFIWLEGKDPSQHWANFCSYLGLERNTPPPTSPAVKAALSANTQEAVERGAFGVPTLALGDRIFWGVDVIDWVNAYADRPEMFSESAYRAVHAIPNGLPPSKA